MRKIIFLFTTAVAFILCFLMLRQSPVTSIAENSQQIIDNSKIPVEKQTLPPTQPPANPMNVPIDIDKLENELADLRLEIDRGDYLSKINSFETLPEIKQELRERIRLFAKKTLQLNNLRMQQLENEKAGVL